MFGTSKLLFLILKIRKAKKNEDVQKQKSIIDSKIRLKRKSCSSSSNLPIYTKT
jgi:hypothetical protein